MKEIKEKKQRAGTKTRTKTNIEEIFHKTARINMQIDSKIQEIEYWRMFASKADIVFSAVGNRGGLKKTKSKIEECICKIAGIEESLKNDMDELIGLKEKAMDIINKINIPEYRNLLVQRYLWGR